jgi:hypothetical protein
MRERIAHEMKAQILKTADHEIMTQYNEQQAKLRKEAERLQNNLEITQQPFYWQQPPQQQHPAPSAIPLPSAHAQQPVPTASMSVVSLPQPSLPMYAFANVGCNVYEQAHNNGYVMHHHQQQHQQPPPPPQRVLYVNNNTSRHCEQYVDYTVEIPQKPAAATSHGRVTNHNHEHNGCGYGDENGEGVEIDDSASGLASIPAMAPLAASTSTLGTFVCSNESVQNLDSVMNSVVNSVNYSVAHDHHDCDQDQDEPHRQDYESCLDFFCGGLEQDV